MPEPSQNHHTDLSEVLEAVGDLVALNAVAIVGRHVSDLATAGAVKLGLFEGGEEHRDLAEARILIEALAGLIDAAAPNSGLHAAAMRDTLKILQQAFREYSPIQDEPGKGPGEKYTGYVAPGR